MLENASFKNEPVGLFVKKNFFPLRRVLEVSAHAKSRAPVEIVHRVIAVSQHGRDRDDALVRVVSEGYENVDNARPGLGERVTREESAERR